MFLLSYLVILANAGTHRIASVVGRYCYCIVVALVVCCGGDVLSVYVRVALLVCLVSSLLFQLLPSSFDLLAFFCLLSRHPRERGDPWYGKCCGLVLLLY
ncbi:hypothetical protein D8X77_12710 [Vibrio vulnificus]|nr:hypothetical protein [Vibrio vulnificus]HAS8219976.1 hypothetical protein [Vibrio vulnificus]HAS8277497.1 hypothetical protein [Vibrio vulnificus]